jgi:hypothetical protein
MSKQPKSRRDRYRIETQEAKMFAVRTMVATIAGMVLACTAGDPARAQKKGKDPKSYGGWIADVERPAAGKSKTPKAKLGRDPMKVPQK